MDRGSFLKLGATGALGLRTGVARAGTPTATAEPLGGKLAPLDIEVAGAALDRYLR